MKRIVWLWAASAPVCGRVGMLSIGQRVRFLLHSFVAYSWIKPLLDAPSQSPLARLLRDRPETIGAVVWPYQCSGWNARTRLDRIRDHYAIIETIGGAIDFPVNGSVLLADLGEIRESLYVLLDQPKWFLREGQLTINLFVADNRIYSLVFSLFHYGDELAAFIGAIQGRDFEGALDQYRELTKAAHGMRPRDLLIEIFRMLCVSLGVRHIHAIANQYRHFQNGYFGDPSTINGRLNDYDNIWTDRGGMRVNPMFFQLGTRAQRRELAEIPTKKRSLYRQRYAMLDAINKRMQARYVALGAETSSEHRQRSGEPKSTACSSIGPAIDT